MALIITDVLKKQIIIFTNCLFSSFSWNSNEKDIKGNHDDADNVIDTIDYDSYD